MSQMVQDSLAVRNTQHFYNWEERGRGWQLYDFPVELEPPFEPFIIPKVPSSEMPVDDSRIESLFDKFKRKSKTWFTPADHSVESVTEYSSTFSYPDNPVPYTDQCVLQTIRLLLPKILDVRVDEMEQFLHMLAYSHSHLSFEVIGTKEGISFQWTCCNADAQKLLSLLQAYFPDCGISLHDSLQLPKIDPERIALADLGLAEEFMRPLNSVSSLSPDALNGVVASLEDLEEGEFGMVQVIFQGCVNAWTPEILSSVSNGAGDSFFIDSPEMPGLAQEKVSKPLYGVLIRVVGQGVNLNRSEDIAYNLIHAIRAQTRSVHNGLIPLSNEGYALEDHLADVVHRQSHRTGMILNSAELATVVHIPDTSVRSGKLRTMLTKTVSPPQAAIDQPFLLGVNHHLGKETPVGLSLQDRLRHMYIIGATGTGKSSLIKNLIVQDMERGLGVVLLDPHGDLTDGVISHIPEDRIEDVIYLDPADTEYPIGLNLFSTHSEGEKITLSSDLVALFRRFATSWGDQMNTILGNAINTILEHEEGGTLLELKRLLSHKGFRERYLKKVHDPMIQHFWKSEFPLLRAQSISPILTRLDTFLRHRIVRNMMAQRGGLDFQEILASNKILLVKLPQGLIGEENSHLLGALIIAKLHQAAFARQQIHEEERNPFFLYVDEFQHFSTPSMTSILSGARKYGLGLVLAHQDLVQLFTQNSELVSSVLSNPSIRICFRVGDMDAKRLEQGFARFDTEDLQNLGVGEAIARVGRSQQDFNLTFDLFPDASEVKSKRILEQIRANTQEHYARPVAEVEAYIQTVFGDREQGKHVVPSKTKSLTIQDSPRPKVSHVSPSVEKSAKAFVESEVQRKEHREHIYLQTLVKRLGESRGFKATIEEPVNDGEGRIDVVLRRDDLSIACEIAVTNTVQNEVDNILKCIKSDHSNVFVLSQKENHLRRIKEEFERIQPQKNLNYVRFVSFKRFSIVLDEIILAPTFGEERIKGYRVNTVYRKLSNATNARGEILQILKNRR